MRDMSVVLVEGDKNGLRVDISKLALNYYVCAIEIDWRTDGIGSNNSKAHGQCEVVW